ncbi:helix-turn-helix domain-containing protein [Bradyrhizobium sp. CCBAU 53338]|uniref:helix-turn-helix domain-containing protein n=1 Tax=Bradyrhizobium sp. CCBAU 53338 TaxID=1325111 RepID=UPI00188C0371|nr:helix-turn-helix domain-containing protein [Bradyrhizobium sp. CCBAU 53338]QOZ55976.1 DNA-binding protein [Bradyrhizobium sp. CCBAU 53338]
MSDKKYLTPEEVSERYRGEISVGTLRNWRAARIGFPFVRIGRAILYPIDALDAWDKAHTVTCRSPAIDVDQKNGKG